MCYSKCPDEKPYYNPTSLECLASCDDKYIYYDGKCDDCNNENFFKTNSLSPKTCTSVCPSSHPYLQSQECTAACTSTKSYEYQCLSSCSSISTYESSGKCFKCEQTLNKFYDSQSSETNKCVLNCPSERPYYDEYNECHASCSAPAKFHVLGSFECKTACDTDYIEFNNICYPSSASCPSGTKKNGAKCECLDK